MLMLVRSAALMLTGAHNPFSVKNKKKKKCGLGLGDAQDTQLSPSCFYSYVEVYLSYQDRPDCTFSWVCWPPVAVHLASNRLIDGIRTALARIIMVNAATMVVQSLWPLTFHLEGTRRAHLPPGSP